MASPASAITLGQVDDFQAGTVAGWRGASPANVADAGPGGVGDNALRVVAQGDRVVIVNETQWTGNYIAAGVTQVSMDVRNESAFPLAMRLGFAQGGVGPGGVGDTYLSATATPVPNDGQWHQVALSMAPESFVPHSANTNPTPNAAAALAAVSHFRILHNPMPSFMGASVLATLFLDNIRAEGASAPQDADFDDDGDVDGNDFLIWQRGLGAGTNMTGDADGDGMVNGADLDVWEAQFGGAPIASAAAAIPEPGAAAIALAGMGLLALAGARPLAGSRGVGE
jgi:hypothetical protein